MTQYVEQRKHSCLSKGCACTSIFKSSCIPRLHLSTKVYHLETVIVTTDYFDQENDGKL
jgi:hypothetical protein